MAVNAQPAIGIVGAGLTGLLAAHGLKKVRRLETSHKEKPSMD